jgi:hypothetical protein
MWHFSAVPARLINLFLGSDFSLSASGVEWRFY